jgi:membrane protein
MLSQTWSLLKHTYDDWREDNAPQLGAALAFYTALSIAPLLVIALGVAALIFADEATGLVEHQMRDLVGDQGGEAITQMIVSANKPATGILATVLSVVTLVLAASGVFGQLQHSLNTIWEVKPKANRGVWGMIRDRFLSFTMVLGVAFLLLVSLVISAALASFNSVLDRLPDSLHWLSQGINFLVSLGVITLLFALMFKVLPDVHMAWRDVWLGAAITAILFMIGKFAIGLYLGHSTMASSYGVAGSFVVLLVWVYYSSQVFFFGAELTQVYANKFGSRIVPASSAEPLSEGLRAQQGLAR